MVSQRCLPVLYCGWMHPSAVVALFTISLLCILHPQLARAQTVSLATATVTPCSTVQRDTWNAVKLLQGGIAGKDMLGHSIGMAPHESGKWFPLLPEKQTICGAQRQIKYNRDGDHDWSLNIEPHPFTPSADLLDAAKLQASEVSCGNNNCVHAEINADQSFQIARELGATLNHGEYYDSTLDGKDVCAYGPWIADGNHGNKPETHPAELIWWRQEHQMSPISKTLFSIISRATLHALLQQDDSNRFDRTSDFQSIDTSSCLDLGLTIVCPNRADWNRAWSKFPRKSELRIAFDADPTGARLRSYVIREPQSRNVVTGDDSDARRDQGDGTEHQIDFDGRPVVRVRELQPDDHIGVLFDDVCLDSTTTKLLGFVVLTSKYGKGDRGDEGYQALEINEADIDQTPGYFQLLRAMADTAGRYRAENQWASEAIDEIVKRQAPLPKIAVEPRFIFAGPLRRVQSSVVSDVILDRELQAPLNLKVSAARFEREKAVSPLSVASTGAGRPLIKDVPVLSGGTVVIELADAHAYRMGIPALGIVPTLRSERPMKPIAYLKAWPTFATASGARRAPGQAPGEVMHGREWAIEFWPQYAAIEDGQPRTDEKNALSDFLNDAVLGAERSKGSSLAQIFGISNPHKVEWKFQARNLRTNRPTSVSTDKDKPARDGILIDASSDTPGIFRVRANFPESADEIYQLDIELNVTDVHGITGTVRHSVWSHYLKPIGDADGTALVRTAATLAGMDATRLAELSHFQIQPQTLPEQKLGRRVRHAQLVRALVIRGREDSRISISELEQLRRIAEAVATLK